MTMRMPRFPLPTLLLLGCAGCGWLGGEDGVFRDRSDDYRKAAEAAEITMPAGEDPRVLREIYAIPPVDERLVPQGEFEVPRPAPLAGGAGAEVVRIQKLGEDSWILIGLAPGQVWPQVRNFLAAAGMQVDRADARQGIIDSNWITLTGRPLASRFRFRMEQGVQRGTSELHVLQMNQAGREDAQWPARSDDPGQAEEMLKAVAQYLADSAESAPVSMIAEQGMRATGKVSLQDTPQGHTLILLELPFERAWASLDLALVKSRFEITDRDHDTGTYYVRYLGPEESEEDGGWFDWLWGSAKHPLAEGMFRVVLRADGDRAVTIGIAAEDGEPLEQSQEQELLGVIKGNIS